MLKKRLSLQHVPKRILSLQDYFQILQFLDEQDIPLYCQGSYLLQQSIFPSLYPNDIDIFGAHPNLQQLEQNLLSLFTIKTKRTALYLQFNFQDCDITIYRDLESLGVGMSSYDIVSRLLFTDKSVQLNGTYSKGTFKPFIYHPSVPYTIYAYNDALNLKGLFHYFFICVQMPQGVAFPKLTQIPEFLRLDDIKMRQYASLYSTKLSTIFKLPKDLCDAILHDLVKKIQPITTLSTRLPPLIQQFQQHFKTAQQLMPVLLDTGCSFSHLNSWYKEASARYPNSKKTLNLLNSLQFTNHSSSELSKQLLIKLIGFIYHIPLKHLDDRYITQLIPNQGIKTLLKLFPIIHETPFPLTEIQCDFFNQCLKHFLSQDTSGDTIKHPQFLSTQTIKITVVKTIPKPVSTPTVKPTHLLAPSPTPTKYSPPKPTPKAKKELFDTYHMIEPPIKNMLRASLEGAKAAEDQPLDQDDCATEGLDQEDVAILENTPRQDVPSKVEEVTSTAQKGPVQAKRPSKKKKKKKTKASKKSFEDFLKDSDPMTLSVKQLGEYLLNVKDMAHALSNTKTLHQELYIFSEPLRKLLTQFFSRWFNPDTVAPPIIETLLSYETFTTLYPKDIFLDYLDFENPTHHPLIIKLLDPDSFDSRFRTDLLALSNAPAGKGSSRKQQKNKHTSPSIAPLRTLSLDSIGSYLGLKLPDFSSTSFEDIRARYLLNCFNEELHSEAPNSAFIWTLISSLLVYDQSQQPLNDKIQLIIEKHLNLDAVKLLKSIYYCFSNEQYERFMPCYYKAHYLKLLSSSVVPAVTAYNPELNLDQQFELIVSHSHHSYGSLPVLKDTWRDLICSHHLLCLSYELSTFISKTPVKIHVTDPTSFIKHICLAYYHVLLSLKTHHPTNRPLLESFHDLVHTFCTLHCHGSLDSVYDQLNYLKKLIQGQSINQRNLLPLFYFMKSVTKISKTTIQRFFLLITSHYSDLISPSDHSVEETFSRLSEFYHLFRQVPIIRDYIKNNISILSLDPKNITIRDIISKWIKDVKDSSLLECLHDSGYDLRYYDTSKIVTNHELPPIAISVDNHSYDCLQFFLEVIYEKGSLPMPNQLPLILSAILVLNFNAARAIQKHTPIDFNTFRMDTHHDSLAHKVTTLPFSQDKFMAICIDFLIELNCLSLLNSQNDIGKTPIHILFEENQAIISKTFLSYLLNHTTLQFPLADLSIQDNTGKSPLDSLKSFLPTHPEREDIVKLLTTHGYTII